MKSRGNQYAMVMLMRTLVMLVMLAMLMMMLVEVLML